MRNGSPRIRQSSIVNRQSERPAAAVAVSFALGIALSQACSYYAFTGLASGVFLLICASLSALRSNRLGLSLNLGLAAILICGLLLGVTQRDSFPDSDLRELLSRHAFPLNEPVSFQGCVIKEGSERGTDVVATVELHAFLQKDRRIVCKGKGILRIAIPDPESAADRLPELRRGDRVSGWAIWRIPRNYENPGSADRAGLLARRGIYLTGRVKSTYLLNTVPGGCGNFWTKLSNRVSGRVRRSLEPIRKEDKGQPAAVLASVVIGDYSGLNAETRETFQNTGTFHVLVVSGLHVAWIAGVLLQFFKWIRLPERIRYLLVALAILLYACVVGFQASITRCLWMFVLYLIGRMMFRRADSVNVLLTSAMVLLSVQPGWLFESGFQLSFLSILAIVLTAIPAIGGVLKPIWISLQHCGKSNRLFLQPDIRHRRGRNLRWKCEIFAEELTDALPPAGARILFFAFRCLAAAGLAIGSIVLTTLSVQLWIEPLLALNFNRISWIAPLATLVVVPLSSLVLSAGIIASIALSLPFGGPAAIRLSGSLSSLLLSATSFFAAIPGAWQRCPTPPPTLVWACIMILFGWSFFRRRGTWISYVPVTVLLACLAYGSLPFWGAPTGNGPFALFSRKDRSWDAHASILGFTFLDVGEGDAIVISFPDNGVWVLDAGGFAIASLQAENAYGLDVGEAVVSRYLWEEWITSLDRVILSHTDMDHAGGIPAVIKNFDIGRFDYSEACVDNVLKGILELAKKRQIVTKSLHAGMKETRGPVTVRVLNPPAGSGFISTNENSIVLEFTFHRFSALLTADLEKAGETEILSQPGDLRGRLLKAAHHGSRTSTSDAFLARTQPRWAVISAGRYNSYGHPSREVLDRLLQYRVRPISTIDEGAITFETDGSRYLIKSHLNGILEKGEL